MSRTILNGYNFISDGFAKHELYSTWLGMIYRCYNSKRKEYNNYGARGIQVCKRWWNLENFINDMNPKPIGKYSIDRIDVNGDYCPENCRSATKIEQENNRRNNYILEYKGEKKTLAEWSKIKNIDYTTLFLRLDRGWDIAKALETKPTKIFYITFDGITDTISGWSKRRGLSAGTLNDRIKNGWSVEDALNFPVGKNTDRYKILVKNKKDKLNEEN